MSSLTETFKYLGKIALTEGFRGIDQHYRFYPGQRINYITTEDGITYHSHGHCIPTVAEFQSFARDLRYKWADEGPLFIGITKEQYGGGAETLARSKAANFRIDSPRTGITVIKGPKRGNGYCYNYKIRWRSEFINRDFFKENLHDNSGAIFDAYLKRYGNQNYCDVVIYTEYPGAIADPNIVTFYVATYDSALDLAKECLKKIKPQVSNEEEPEEDTTAVSSENSKEAKLIILDTLGIDTLSARHPITYNIPNVIVATPTSITHSKTDHGKKNGIVDDVFKFNKGYMFDPKSYQKVDINVADELNKADNLDKSSKVIGNARETFERATMKVYFRQRGVKHSARTRDNLVAFWAASPEDALNYLKKDPVIASKFVGWGLSKVTQPDEFKKVCDNLYKQIKIYWEK